MGHSGNLPFVMPPKLTWKLRAPGSPSTSSGPIQSEKKTVYMTRLWSGWCFIWLPVTAPHIRADAISQSAAAWHKYFTTWTEMETGPLVKKKIKKGTWPKLTQRRNLRVYWGYYSYVRRAKAFFMQWWLPPGLLPSPFNSPSPAFTVGFDEGNDVPSAHTSIWRDRWFILTVRMVVSPSPLYEAPGSRTGAIYQHCKTYGT